MPSRRRTSVLVALAGLILCVCSQATPARARTLPPAVSGFNAGSGHAGIAHRQIGFHRIASGMTEINPAWSAVVSFFAAAGLILRHRANLRK